MKILHIIPRMIGGGPERSVLALASEMAGIAGSAYEHVMVVLDVPIAKALLLRARRLGIKVVVRPDRAVLDRHIIDADVVLVHYWNHPNLLSLLQEQKLPPARLVLHSRVLGLTAPQVLSGEIGCFGDALVLTTEASMKSAGALAARTAGKPVVVLPAIADMRRLDGFTRRPSDSCVVGYLGAVNDAKMHPHFAQMAASITNPSVRFLICGGGGGEAKLRRDIDALGVGSRTEIIGPVEDIRPVLERMDIFGYPLAEQTYATSEQALQEAMWVGLPPVVFPYGGIRHLVENERTGLVAQTEKEYAEAIDRLATDASLRLCLGREAQKFARQNFDPARRAKATIAFLDEVASWPRRDRSPLKGGHGAAGFLAALGDLSGPFAASYAGPSALITDLDVERADHLIANSHASLARGEGGVIHYRNAALDDAHLRLWSGLIAEQTGDFAQARAEYEAAFRLGLSDVRPSRYMDRCKEGSSLHDRGVPPEELHAVNRVHFR